MNVLANTTDGAKPVYDVYDQFFCMSITVYDCHCYDSISACFALLGTIILSIACFTYYSEKDDYVWSLVNTKFNNNWVKFLEINEKPW